MFVNVFPEGTSRPLEVKFCTIRWVDEASSHVINIRKLNELGTNESDVITKALDSYGHSHEKKHNFGFMHCWAIVKVYLKFFDMEKIATPKQGKKNWT